MTDRNMTQAGGSRIRDPRLAPSGRQKLDWVRSHMPLLEAISEEFSHTRPLQGHTVAVCLHLEAKTGRLLEVLRDAGARVAVCGSNPLSTQDDVAAALADSGVRVFAWHGTTPEEYRMLIGETLDCGPDALIDDGGDLVGILHAERGEQAGQILGGCEETTTGILRLRSMAREGALRFPMMAVNDAYCKYLFDNRYGTGQSVWDGIVRTTNLVVAGKTVVVVGYGWCGKGVAMRARGLGARVVVTEIDPIKAIEAYMDGFEVLPMAEAAARGDFFVTVTGNRDVIAGDHFDRMKDGAILCNAGHFDVEISKPDLESRSRDVREARRNIDAYTMEDGRRLYLLVGGRLVNLAAADGHPAEVMDLTFALQALSLVHVIREGKNLGPGVWPVPAGIDERVARLRLATLDIGIDTLSTEQEEYLAGWRE